MRTSPFTSSLLIFLGGSILLLSSLIFIIDPALGIDVGDDIRSTSSTGRSTGIVSDDDDDDDDNLESVSEEPITIQQKMSTGEIPKDFVRHKIDSHDVMVFARSYGPHNRQAKELLERLSKTLALNVKVEFLDVDLLPGWDGSLIMTELEEITDQWSFPNIFIGKEHVGGNNELDQLHALGELEDMIINNVVGQEL